MTVMAVLVTIDSPGALLPKRLNGGRSGQMSGRPRRTLKCLNIYIHTYIHYILTDLTSLVHKRVLANLSLVRGRFKSFY